ncbi:MAG TPA: DUF6807 family protein [Pirellulaceae bacterium]|nr:DUF6807 family protein [Pirellulaceae bacterium]
MACTAAADEAAFQAEKHDDRFVITHGGKPVATYVFRDEKILRPYFAHVHAPDGTQVTRHHPPRPGIDAVDHDTMHPGIWLAFGDVSGADFWRNKGQVDVEHINESPRLGDNFVSIVGYNHYAAGGQEIGRELFTRAIRIVGDGYLLSFYSRFDAPKSRPFTFGDQEEMGLGLRLATPLAVKGGSGTITNSTGGKNEKEVWGKQADWCDYSGIIEREGEKRRVGMLLIPHKDNFRRSWFHARDYGFVAANPFGQNAFTNGEKSRIEVKPGEHLDLRFGVWIYSTPADQPPDLDSIAWEYHRLAYAR